MKKSMILAVIWGATLGLFAQTNKQSGNWAEMQANRIADSLMLQETDHAAFVSLFGTYSDSIKALWGSQDREEMKRLYEQRNSKVEALLNQDTDQVALYYSLLKERPNRVHARPARQYRSHKRSHKAMYKGSIEERAQKRAELMGNKLELSAEQTQELEKIYLEDMEMRAEKRKEMRKEMRTQQRQTDQKIQEILQTPEQKEKYSALKKERKQKRGEHAKKGKRKGERGKKQKNAPKNHTD